MAETTDGRRIVLGVIAWLVVGDAVAIAFGPLGVVMVIRSLLTLALCFYLYLGAPAARWFAMLAFAFGCAVGFASDSTVLQVVGGINAVFVLLMFSRPVETYFR